jgi:probable F420-dependent oxidoreductase
MDFGVATVSRGECSSREGYTAVAEAAEGLGFGFISVNDHVVVPHGIASRYPYSESGEWAARTAGDCLEQITTLGFLAARTERLKLLTSVMVVPHRQPVLAAKMLATVDVLSKGRLIVGCGAGWMQEEFEALGAPPFAERGRATDEYLDAFKALWTQDTPELKGKHVSFGDMIFAPKPVSKPHPPIWIGGESPAGLKRAVRVGDGWYPACNNPQFRLDTPERLGAGIAELHKLAQAAGRDPKSIDIGYLVLWPVDWSAQKTVDGTRRVFTGSAADMAADAAALAKVGVKHVALTFQTATVAETLARMQNFAQEVIPMVRRAH